MDIIELPTISEVPDEKITATGALIYNDEGYILAFARKSDETKLGLVAGMREKEDVSLKDAAIREVKEETGLNFSRDEFPDEPFFVRPPLPSDEGYCATFILKYKGQGPFPVANLDGEGIPEGYAFWVKPKDFIKAGRSAFLEYNTLLLKKATEAGYISLSS